MLKILIPLDGSTVAEESLQHAVRIAEIFPAEVCLLRVISESNTDSDVRMDTVDFALWRCQAAAYLADVQNRYKTPNFSVSYRVSEGNAAETIVQYINETKPDLLILTRYGRGNALEFATGGTAQKVLSSANCSVLLLDPRHPARSGEGYRQILVPVDEGKDSDCAVAVATMMGEIHNASVILLHVTNEANLPSDFPDTRRARELVEQMNTLMRSEAERRLRELAGKIPAHIPVQTIALVSPDTSLAIESLAEEADADLVLLHTSDTHQGLGRQYDAVNQALIRYSHRPLFILRPTSGEGLASNFRSVYMEETRSKVS